MLRAKDIISGSRAVALEHVEREVDGMMPLVDVLPRLLDAPGRLIGVRLEGALIGVVDERSLLEGIGEMLPGRDDSCVVTVECAPGDYSAERLARAVEDVDAHLVDLWSRPASDGNLEVSLRVRRTDPTPVVHSLERYGYEVTDVAGRDYQDEETAIMRLLELHKLLNV